MTPKMLNGPDQILPAEELTTIHPDQPVRLRIPESGFAIETTSPISIPGLLQQIAEKYPNSSALGYKENGCWKIITYKDYLDQARTCAKAFINLGLERHYSVCILGFNSVEWFLSDIGAIFAGGIAVGIYTTNSSEACFHCADYSRANIIVVQDQKQLDKILAIKPKLKHLKAIIQYEGKPTVDGVLSWSDMMAIGKNESDDILNQRLKSIGVNECCTIVFTSGTVGKPKGVMLSHDNLTWDALAVSELVNLDKAEERLVSYLPLSHVAAQLVDIYIVMMNAGCVYFADPDALKGTLVKTLQEVQPTRFLGVPRVWEKMYERMMEVAAQNGEIKKALASWAKNQALQHHLNKLKGNNSNKWGYYIANTLIFSKIKKALGLDKCKIFVSAAAPLSMEIKRYFLSIDILINEAYGMSETSGAHTLSTENSFGLETAGPALQGTKTKITNVDDQENGEVCVTGRHIFLGYLNDQQTTEDSIDSEGWLHTGDIGRLNSKQNLCITGRLKELIITAGGENIPPTLIEHTVKAEIPQINNVVVIGDKRKYLTVLLTLKTEIDPETGTPLDTLLPVVQNWLNELGCPATTVTEVLNAGPHPKLYAALKEGIDRVNQQAISNAQRIQKLSILPRDFSIPTGELGPTLKIKRNVVQQKYADIIEKMYS